jgi:hypothetical protein
MLQPPKTALKQSAKTTQKPPLRDHARIMTPSELHADMIQFADKLSTDPDAAAQFLKKAGILDTRGKLAKGYR